MLNPCRASFSNGQNPVFLDKLRGSKSKGLSCLEFAGSVFAFEIEIPVLSEFLGKR